MSITIKDLERIVNRLNELTGSPMEYNSNKKGEPFKANIGHYCLSGAYGGWELQRVMSHGGGVETPMYTGHIPKRELYEKIQVLITGIELGKGA